MKSKLQSALEKIYMPSADKVVEGLSKFDGEAGTNVLQGHEQAVELVGGLAGRSDLPVSVVPPQHQEAKMEERAQWAAEVRRADERCDMLTQANQEMQARFAHEQAICKGLVEKIKVRDEEIMRLHSLYLPAQNLEKLNLKHLSEESERIVKKLEGQVDFLNKENDKLQRQVDLLKVDETGSLALAQVDALKRDLADASNLIDKIKRERDEVQKNYRDALIHLEEAEVQHTRREEHEQSTQLYILEQNAELKKKSESAEATEHRSHALKSAYNADRRVLQEQIEELHR